MRKPEITAKRVLGAVLASSLAVAGTVAMAGSSEAAVDKYKTDASTSSGAVISVTGTGFTDSNGAATIDVAKVHFSTAACTSVLPTSTNYAVTAASVVSDTKVNVTVDPATLTLVNSKPTKYNICFYDTAATQSLVGATSTTVYTAPATLSAGNFLVGTTTITNANYATALAGSALGGTKLTVKGQDFTAKTVVTVGGKPLTGAKVVLGKTTSDLDVITGLTPAGASSAAALKIEGEFGKLALKETGVNAAAALTWAYNQALSVSPNGSDGTSGRVITVTGVGFSSRSFVAATGTGTGGGKSVVFLLPANVANSAFISSNNSATPTGSFICASPTVVSDTELTCTIPALTSAYGAYTVAVKAFTGAAGAQTLDTANSTGYSRASTYTAAQF